MGGTQRHVIACMAQYTGSILCHTVLLYGIVYAPSCTFVVAYKAGWRQPGSGCN